MSTAGSRFPSPGGLGLPLQVTPPRPEPARAPRGPANTEGAPSCPISYIRLWKAGVGPPLPDTATQPGKPMLQGQHVPPVQPPAPEGLQAGLSRRIPRTCGGVLGSNTSTPRQVATRASTGLPLPGCWPASCRQGPAPPCPAHPSHRARDHSPGCEFQFSVDGTSGEYTRSPSQPSPPSAHRTPTRPPVCPPPLPGRAPTTAPLPRHPSAAPRRPEDTLSSRTNTGVGELGHAHTRTPANSIKCHFKKWAK